jgi:hypothetical protein
MKTNPVVTASNAGAQVRESCHSAARQPSPVSHQDAGGTGASEGGGGAPAVAEVKREAATDQPRPGRVRLGKSKGMIVSASYKTDIPAFYGRWFINRLRAGFCCAVNPYSGQVYRVPLDRSAVSGFVFWTKNIAPFRNHLQEVRERGYPFYVHYTINGYPREIERSVVDAEQSVEHAHALRDSFGPRVVVWRYDTILLSSLTPPQFHIDNFSRLAGMLAGATDEVVVSFAQIYEKTERNLGAAARASGFTWSDPPDDDKRILLGKLAEVAGGLGLRVGVCAQRRYVVPGTTAARCVDADRLGDIAGVRLDVKVKGNRPECGCFESRDIGEYDTCPHGCVYCYAVRNRGLALARYKHHDPASPFLFGPPGGPSPAPHQDAGGASLVPSHGTAARSTPKGRDSMKPGINPRSHQGHGDGTVDRLAAGPPRATGGAPLNANAREVVVGAPSDSNATEVKRDVTTWQRCWCGRPHEQDEVRRMDPDQVRCDLGLSPLWKHVVDEVIALQWEQYYAREAHRHRPNPDTRARMNEAVKHWEIAHEYCISFHEHESAADQEAHRQQSFAEGEARGRTRVQIQKTEAAWEKVEAGWATGDERPEQRLLDDTGDERPEQRTCNEDLPSPDVLTGVRHAPALSPEDRARDEARRAKVEALWAAAGGRPVRLSRAEWLAAHPPGPSKAERVRRATKRHDEATRRW